MEPEWQNLVMDADVVDGVLTDLELALALQEEELAQPGIADDPKEIDTKECEICCEEKHINLYAQCRAGNKCKCLSEVCLVCIQRHLKAQTESKQWAEGSLTCPVCDRSLSPHEIEEYADAQTMKFRLSHMIEQTIKGMPDFIRCPNTDCNSGQVHEGGDSRPFVTCAACNTQFCFRHGIPTQHQQQQQQQQQQQRSSSSRRHENMSCDEYDRYLADPLRFRSEHQRQQEQAEVERREASAVGRARERVERILQQRRETAREGARGGEDAAREEQERRGRAGREERARLERRRYEAELARARGERRAALDEVLRRKREDEQSVRLIGVSTKACPQCATRIEKNNGCMHMTCPCGHEFCWECMGPWVANSCQNCFFGGPVLQFEHLRQGFRGR